MCWWKVALVAASASGLAGGGFGFGVGKVKKKRAPSLRPLAERRLGGVVLPRSARPVPAGIARPDYAVSGRPGNVDLRPGWMVDVKSAAEIQGMRLAGAAAREVLDAAGRAVAAGATTDAIDAVAHAAAVARNCYPSPLNYHGFPKSVCTSVNEVICHGIPDDVPLEAGDVVNVDVTVYLDGFHGDCSEMFYVGAVDAASEALVEATYACWQAAINVCAPGVAYREIGGVIEDALRGSGLSSVEQFVGHGIGSVFHTHPNVLHYRNSDNNGVMAPGHTFTIEPMVCEGTIKSRTWPDDWTAVTADGGRSAQFEHTLLITETGVEALTGKTPDSPRQPWEGDAPFPRVWPL